MGAHVALFRGEQALRTAQATGAPQTDEAACHLALASAQLEQAHALATSGQSTDAVCAAERSALDSALCTAINNLDAP